MFTDVKFYHSQNCAVSKIVHIAKKHVYLNRCILVYQNLAHNPSCMKFLTLMTLITASTGQQGFFLPASKV